MVCPAQKSIQSKDPTIAELLKNHGYVSGQFGKNHLGDQDEHLPTNHGFDEFFGNLYHLNAEEEPESEFYPKDPEFRKKFGPRGVLKATADGKIEDTGPLTRKRMENVDREFMDASLAFMEKAVKEDKPFFIWHNSTRMHVWTHLSEEYQGKSGYGLYADGMMDLDDQVGVMLDKLEELGVADNTIVVFSTDNGAEKFTCQMVVLHRSRAKKVRLEGGFRVPMMVRWPGNIKPGTVINDIFSQEDWMPTLLAAVGEPDVKEKLLKGHKAAGKTFKAHLDGYNQLDLLTGKADEGARKEIFYFDAGGNLNAVRYKDWKIHFSIMEGAINEAYRKTPSWPLIVNLRMDPFEVGPDAALYVRHFYADQMWMFVPAQAIVRKFLETFKEFPATKGSSLSIEKVVETMTQQPRN